jgi:3-methyladenine DNA glycosylase/8-oxoguanine DNA glycosylase
VSELSRTRRWRLERPLSVVDTLRPLQRSSADPTMRFVAGACWRASRTPDGPATVSVQLLGDEVTITGWGPGADWMLHTAPDLLGENDDWSTLDMTAHPIINEVRRRRPGARLCRTNLVMEALVPACLEQRVTGTEAWRAWRKLIRRYSEPAPGPTEVGLWLPPTPDGLRAVTSWDWHLFGVDPGRARTIRAAATVAGRLEQCATQAVRNDAGPSDDFAAAARRLRLVPGVGEWTAAEVTLRALGDPDAVSVGDFHLKNLVGFALAGHSRSDDDVMLQLLEPWRGQRARVIRLIELSGATPPKFGPRFSPNDISRI